RYQFVQKLQALCSHLSSEKINARRIAAWPGKAGDKSKPDRIFVDAKDDGDCCGCCLGSEGGGRSECGNHGNLAAYQLGCQRRKSIILAIGPAIDNGHVLAFNIAGFRQGTMKSAQPVRDGVSRRRIEKSDHRHRTLRARRQRPRGRAAEERESVAPLHSITSLARSSIEVGTSSSSTLAVLRLRTNSKFVAPSNGRSAGLAPLRIFSTSPAQRRYAPIASTP